MKVPGKAQNHIVLIDHNSMNIELYSLILRKLNAQIHITMKMDEALNLLKDLSPDIIAVDMAFPPIANVKYPQEIRKVLTNQCPKIIAISSCVMKGDRELLLSAGYDAFIPVPINAREFYHVFERYLFGSKAECPICTFT